MAYDVKELSEKNGLQTRASVLETPQGRFVVLQTYEQRDSEWKPIHVFSQSGSAEDQTVAGRLYSERTEGDRIFSVTQLEQREAGVREYLKGLPRASGHKGGVGFW
ncbi:MAG: hypothetical protein WC613_04065 [Candidatus Aenigmatarchaeota archaeon]